MNGPVPMRLVGHVSGLVELGGRGDADAAVEVQEGVEVDPRDLLVVTGDA